MNSRPTPTDDSAVPLPSLSIGVLNRFKRSPPSFDTMLRHLHRYDPAAARWLYSAAEELAPGDIDDKERYATLALGLYYMLVEQSFVDKFSDLMTLPPVKIKRAPRPFNNQPSDNRPASV